ncbi:putative glyoxalase superfamily protein PhnB [Cupriavidus gilardii J11]|uniref:Putative glyoxalase superfamily protein PhnB n=1 Tax=Cupriavidus gilardii J11 TaxID=936133 RepID=A0A562BIS5_9BURK|nr:VOC family protein [Cupriavidus gilardii]TWG84933.1 putative glyoxalase superfamily protein PhnB [Cupriavidus gilardii J11]
MADSSRNSGSTLIPCLRYRDAHAAITWLCNAFGFEAQMVVENDDGTVAHAQLRYRNGMIMLGSVMDSPYGRLMRQPDEVDGAQTQSIYVVVDDADAVYRKAKEGGATIVLELRDQDYGGRDFSCFDPEGHLWTIGTYDPW